MKILFVKLTSMGDLIHALPAMTDAMQAIPGISFDWVIDKNFSEVGTWHPAVKNVFRTDHRGWRKNFLHSIKTGTISEFLKGIRETKYDFVIDGQSNFKSALIMMLARGTRCGLDKNSTREWIAHLAYQNKFHVPKSMHAIERLRQLFSMALQYPLKATNPDYGIAERDFPLPEIDLPNNYLVFVHNASWPSKLWPQDYWHQLIDIAADENFHILLPWGNAFEKQRAEELTVGHKNAQVLPFCTLSQLAGTLKNSKGAICSDTGLSHLAASLNVSAVTMYGPTSVALIGTTGQNQQHSISSFPCVECYKHECHYEKKTHEIPLCLSAIKPETVWQSFKRVISRSQK